MHIQCIGPYFITMYDNVLLRYYCVYIYTYGNVGANARRVPQALFSKLKKIENLGPPYFETFPCLYHDRYMFGLPATGLAHRPSHPHIKGWYVGFWARLNGRGFRDPGAPLVAGHWPSALPCHGMPSIEAWTNIITRCALAIWLPCVWKPPFYGPKCESCTKLLLLLGV